MSQWCGKPTPTEAVGEGPKLASTGDEPDLRDVRLVVFILDGARYAVRLSETERVLRMVAVSPLPGAPRVFAGVINLHGSVVPVVDVRRRLGLSPRAYGPDAHLLVVKSSRRALALPADEVLGVRTLPEGAEAEGRGVVPAPAAIAGIAALSDGLVFIHDLEAFLSDDEERSLDRALEAT